MKGICFTDHTLVTRPQAPTAHTVTKALSPLTEGAETVKLFSPLPPKRRGPGACLGFKSYLLCFLAACLQAGPRVASL